jgi:hypothetical protein
MATKTVVCPECEAPLAPGRFSCSSCGALVASVATAARPFVVLEPVVPPILTEGSPSPFTDSPDPAEAAHAVNNGVVASVPPPADEDDGWDHAVVADDVTPTDPPTPRAVVPPPAVEASKVKAPPAVASPPKAAKPPARPAKVPAGPTGVPAEPAVLRKMEPSEPTASPQWPEHPTWPLLETAAPMPAGPEAPAASDPGPEPEASLVSDAGAELEAPVRVPAGAYLPPSAVLPPGEALPIPQVASPAFAAAPVGVAAGSVGATGGWAAPATTAALTRVPKLPDDFLANAVAVGAGIGAVGMILPWAPIVIGSATREGYLSQWGLAGPGHMIVLLLLGGLAALAVASDKLPSWAHPGVPAIAAGCLLVGLVWPYVLGPFGASLGVYLEVVAAVVLIGAGSVELATGRHAKPPADV